MDDEQRKYFAEMMGMMEGVSSDARAAASTSRETAATVRKLDSRIGAVEGNVAVLQKHVFGSTPPPAPPTRPMAASIGEHDGDIAEVKGQLMAVQSELEKQSKKMNVDVRGFWRFVHDTKVQDVAKLATLAAALYAALHGVK